LDLMNHHPESVKEIIELKESYVQMRDSAGMRPNGYTIDVLYKAWFDKYAVRRGEQYGDAGKSGGLPQV